MNAYPYFKIKEIKFIRSVKHFLSNKSFVVIDLDNTIIEPLDEVGSDQFYEAILAIVLNNDPSVTHELFTILRDIQNQITVQAVEKIRTLDFINFLKSCHIPVLAVTSRGFDLAECTVKQLGSVDIHLDQQWSLPKIQLGEGCRDQPPFYFNGIIYCSGNNKGECLKKFFLSMGKFPLQLVAVDDKKKNLEDIIFSLKDNIEHIIGLRYGYLDQKIKNFQFKNKVNDLGLFSQKFSPQGLAAFNDLKRKNIISDSVGNENKQISNLNSTFLILSKN